MAVEAVACGVEFETLLSNLRRWQVQAVTVGIYLGAAVTVRVQATAAAVQWWMPCGSRGGGGFSFAEAVERGKQWRWKRGGQQQYDAKRFL